jgi:hypothetical protein
MEETFEFIVTMRVIVAGKSREAARAVMVTDLEEYAYEIESIEEVS